MMKSGLAALALVALSACAPKAQTPQDQFFAHLTALCGKSFAGAVVVGDPERDAAFANQPLVMEVRECSDTEIRIPFHVGDDHSRTWVITRTENGLRLKHDHRHEDGSADVLTQYGGDSTGEGSPVRQEFPADQHSKDLFTAQDIAASAENVWALEITPEAYFAYELTRPERHFRVEFNLRETVDAPPPPWGAEPAAN